MSWLLSHRVLLSGCVTQLLSQPSQESNADVEFKLELETSNREKKTSRPNFDVVSLKQIRPLRLWIEVMFGRLFPMIQ